MLIVIGPPVGGETLIADWTLWYIRSYPMTAAWLLQEWQRA